MDRAGYYICWGCLVYLPALYPSVSLYLVAKPIVLGIPVALLILACGALSIYINYDVDRQKLAVRTSDGQCLVWGKKPTLIRAKYTLESGETKESLLLASGWWGLARHFHYVPEILLAFFWTVPAAPASQLMPFTYVIYLTILLTHRSYRDDRRCEDKYGAYWQEYRKAVPARIIPFVF
jgi:7-dehydrocholesterol reductase